MAENILIQYLLYIETTTHYEQEQENKQIVAGFELLRDYMASSTAWTTAAVRERERYAFPQALQK